MQDKNKSPYYCVKCPCCDVQIEIKNNSKDAYATLSRHYSQRHKFIPVPDAVQEEPTVSLKKRRTKRIQIEPTTYITSTQQSPSKARFPKDYETHLNSLEEVAIKELKVADVADKKKRSREKYNGISEVCYESEEMDNYHQNDNDTNGQEEQAEENHHDLGILLDSHTLYQQLKNRSTPVSKQFNEQEAFDLFKKLL